MADDDIIVDLGGGRTASFPKGMSTQRIEFELKRAGIGGPPEPSAGAKFMGGNPIIAAFQGLRGVAPDIADWAATRGITTGSNIAGAPRATGELIQNVTNWAGQKTGVDPNILMRSLPLAAQVAPAIRSVAPSADTIRRGALDAIGQREVNLPGRVGKVVDSAVEAGIGGLPFGLAAILPSAAGGAGSEAAGQMTEGTPWETWARLLGGAVGGGAGALGQAGVKYGWQAGKSLVDPFYQGGRDKIVGSTLNKAASDPKTAVPRMQGSQPTVPGSQPTAAQAANDPGLLALENVVKGRAGDPFAVRAAESNAARMAAADKVAAPVTPQQAGDTIRGAMQAQKDALEATRSKTAGPLYESARASGGPLDPKPILDSINKSIMTETGPIRSALQRAKGALYLGDGTNKRLATNVAEMQAVRRALDAQIGGVRDNSTLERVLVGIRNQVDDALKSDATFKRADETFRALSEPLRPYSKEYGPRVAKSLETGPYSGPYTRPSELLPDDFLKRGTTGVDEMLAASGVGNTRVKEAFTGRLMDDFKSAIRTTADDPLNNKVLSAAAADRWWQANKDVAAKVMTPDQMRGMQTLVDDFAVGARRPQGVAGSNTAQNLASGNMLNAILRFRTLADSSAAQTTFGRALSFLYKIPEEQIQDTLLKAMMDPKVASALMVKASPANAKLLAPMLARAIAPVAGTTALELSQIP